MKAYFRRWETIRDRKYGFKVLVKCPLYLRRKPRSAEKFLIECDGYLFSLRDNGKQYEKNDMGTGVIRMGKRG